MLSSSPPYGRGQPSSSPLAPTTSTAYSPDMARNGQSSVAASKQKDVDTFTINGTVYDGIYPRPHENGVFVNEVDASQPRFVSRFVFVERTPHGTPAGTDQEMEQHQVQTVMKLYKCFDKAVPVYSRGICIRFDSLVDACEALELFRASQFVVSFKDSYEFALAKSHDTASMNEFEGQMMVVVAVETSNISTPLNFDFYGLQCLCESLERMMNCFGRVRTYVHYKTTETDTQLLLFFRFEFQSVEAATRAVASLKIDPMGGMDQQGTVHWTTVNVTAWNGERAPNSPHRIKPHVDDMGRKIGYAHATIPDLSPRCRAPDNHNKVHRGPIVNGTDVRTTIMLRNIPNKLDHISLKNILDQVCFGTYDFVYLRIDFKTGCNVGYAFINFTDVRGMLAMLDKVEGFGWVGYRSSKNAEISYATIQGREALISKFRNSSVMLETPFCRPRLFISYQEAIMLNNVRLTGVEQPFAAPDNKSKLMRSIDSARAVGLFPPTGIANNHRNGMTTYDRGNPRDLFQQPLTGASPNLPKHVQDECELYNYRMNGPSASGHLVPFQFLSQSVVNAFLQGQRRNTHGAPGVIARPQFGRFDAFDQPRTPPHNTRSAYASGSPTAGPSGTPRAPMRMPHMRDNYSTSSFNRQY